MKNNYIENTNRDLYMAWPIENKDGEREVCMSPIIAWRMEEIDTNNGVYFESFPMSINHAVQCVDNMYFIYNKRTNEWKLPGGSEGIGKDTLLEYVKKW